MLAMVVEDDTGLRSIYRRVLERIDFEVLEAPDGMVAMSLLETHTPDIVFLDMLLPNINGATVLSHLTTTPRLQQTRVVIVSSNRQFEKLLQPDLPISFVLKPIRPAQIREYALAVLEK